MQINFIFIHKTTFQKNEHRENHTQRISFESIKTNKTTEKKEFSIMCQKLGDILSFEL